MATPVIECLEYGALSEADARELTDLQIATWPPANPADAPRQFQQSVAALLRPSAYRGPAPRRPRIYCLRENGKIIAQSRIFPRAILTSRGPLTILALEAVCTAKSQQGRGLGLLVMKETFKPVDTGAFPCSLFQTAVPGFWEKVGARLITNRIVNSLGANPDACPFWDPHLMVYPAAYDWPEGTVDLQGPGY